jgi:hypothetical protein
MQNNFDSISGDDFLTSSDMYMNMNQDPGYYSSPALNEVDNSASSLSLESHSSSPTARMVRSNIPPSLLIGGSASPQEFAAMPSPYMESPYTADPYTSDMTTLMEMHELNSSLPSSPFFTTSFFGTMDTSSVSQLTPPEYSPSEKASAYTSALAYPYSSYTSGDKTPTSPSSFSSPYNYPNGNDNNATPVFPDQQTIKRAMDAAANGAKTFICEFTGCSRTFQQFQNLKSHWKLKDSVAMNATPASVVCLICIATREVCTERGNRTSVTCVTKLLRELMLYVVTHCQRTSLGDAQVLMFVNRTAFI